MTKKKNECYTDLLSKLDSLDLKIRHVKNQLQDLRAMFSTKAEDNEVCIDEVEADKAAYDAIREICIESLIETDPKGDA